MEKEEEGRQRDGEGGRGTTKRWGRRKRDDKEMEKEEEADVGRRE